MVAGHSRAASVVVRGGVRIVPPAIPGDCTCVVCALYRSGHLLRRAIVMTVLTPVPFLLALWAGPASRQEGVGYGTQVVGALLIVGTLMLPGMCAAWWSPLRRCSHRHHPRSATWPPP